MIMPFMQNGDVKSFVKSKRGNSIECDCFPEVHVAGCTSHSNYNDQILVT